MVGCWKLLLLFEYKSDTIVCEKGITYDKFKKISRTCRKYG